MKNSRHILVTLATLLIATPSFGQSPDIIVTNNAPTAVVSYADLNLTAQPGVDALNGRIHRAAADLCLDNNLRELKRWTMGRNCMDVALRGAEEQVAQAIANARTDYAGRSSIVVAVR
jgi:UrcA family protein